MLLSQKQLEFARYANHRWNFKGGATRSGKTYLDFKWIIPLRIRERAGKDGLAVILGVTKSTIERNVLEPMRNLYGDKLVGTISSDNTAWIFGEKCYCLGAEKVSQVSKIRGASIKYCYGDEVADWSEEVFALLKSRLDKEYSCFDGTYNPQYPNHWLKKFLDSNADEAGHETSRQTVYDFKGPGVLQAMHNRDDSILSFARCCFTYALNVKQDVWFSSKDTISKDYDQTFKLLFQKVFDEEFKARFDEAGLNYRYALIDDVAAKVIRSEGGIIWACKNYDGDVMSDLIAAASGSLPMMTSVLVSPDGNFEYEAAHGTVVDHYHKWREGKPVSTNPLATIAGWAGALHKRGELDGNEDLMHFADCLSKAGVDVFEDGYLSEDLARLCDPAELREMPENGRLMHLIRERLETLLSA